MHLQLNKLSLHMRCNCAIKIQQNHKTAFPKARHGRITPQKLYTDYNFKVGRISIIKNVRPLN